MKHTRTICIVNPNIADDPKSKVYVDGEIPMIGDLVCLNVETAVDVTIVDAIRCLIVKNIPSDREGTIFNDVCTKHRWVTWRFKLISRASDD